MCSCLRTCANRGSGYTSRSISIHICSRWQALGLVVLVHVTIQRALFREAWLLKVVLHLGMVCLLVDVLLVAAWLAMSMLSVLIGLVVVMVMVVDITIAGLNSY